MAVSKPPTGNLPSSTEDLVPDGMKPTPVDINKPQWDQAQFSGRMRRFLAITNPMLIFSSKDSLEKARILVEKAR